MLLRVKRDELVDPGAFEASERPHLCLRVCPAGEGIVDSEIGRGNPHWARSVTLGQVIHIRLIHPEPVVGPWREKGNGRHEGRGEGRGRSPENCAVKAENSGEGPPKNVVENSAVKRALAGRVGKLRGERPP